MKLNHAAYRTYQFATKQAAKFLDFNPPETLTGAGCITQLPARIKKLGINKVLLVTDAGITKLGLTYSLLKALEDESITYFIYDKTQPNPTIENIEQAKQMYLDNACEGLIAFGGGSPMDCAKVAAARVAKPAQPVSKMRGFVKILKKLPPLFAVPTTAGTGSETTIAAVVTDPQTHIKYAVTDPSLKPVLAVLDPKLTVGLPSHITAATGMDALTHAVEAIIGRSNTEQTEQWALKATALVFENLQTAYSQPQDLAARENMLTASFYAGAAFTRAYIGYVHAIAHCMGGMYGTPHGLANAVILPYVLDWFGSSAYQRLAMLARAAHIGSESSSDEVRAKAFIAAIRQLNADLGLPAVLDCVRAQDVELIAQRAVKEGNPYYPVPRIISIDECMAVVRRCGGLQ